MIVKVAATRYTSLAGAIKASHLASSSSTLIEYTALAASSRDLLEAVVFSLISPFTLKRITHTCSYQQLWSCLQGVLAVGFPSGTSLESQIERRGNLTKVEVTTCIVDVNIQTRYIRVRT